jgi:sugar phosphate isomerase/epimerase
MKSCVTISLVPSLKGGPWILWDKLEKSLQTASQIGFDGVELFTQGASVESEKPLDELLSQYNLTLGAVGTGAGKVIHGLSLTDKDAIVRSDAKLFIKEMISFGANFNAPTILGSMQGSFCEQVDRETALSYLREALEELGDHAISHGTFFIYEPLNRYETNLFNLFEEACRFCKNLNTNGVKVLADLFHMNIEEEDIAATIKPNADMLGHVHFADSNRKPVGYGHTEMKPICDCLKEINYSGYVSAEAFAFPDPETAAKRTLQSFRKFFYPTDIQSA